MGSLEDSCAFRKRPNEREVFKIPLVWAIPLVGAPRPEVTSRSASRTGGLPPLSSPGTKPSLLPGGDPGLLPGRAQAELVP